MKTKLGFYYNLPFEDYHNYLFLVTFENGHLAFRCFPNRRQRLGYIHCSNMSYYSFDYPVLYKEDEAGNVSEMVLIRDIPIVTKDTLKNQGLEIYVPFYEGKSFDSFGLDEIVLGLGKMTSNSFFDTSIYYDGQDLFSKTGTKESFDFFFFKIVLIEYVLDVIVNKTKGYAWSLSSMDFYKERVSKLKEYIDSINLDSILDGYKVYVEEYFRHKIGDDDSYSVYRTASVDKPVDLYLSEILGIGEHNIYSDRGYCTAESMALTGLVTGDYAGDDLEKEKNRIKEEYSKEVHLGTLLSALCSTIQTGIKYLPPIERALELFKSTLYDDFKLNAISNEGRKLERNFYPFHQTIRDRIKEEQEMNRLNSITKETTQNTFTAEKLNVLKQFSVYYDPWYSR